MAVKQEHDVKPVMLNISGIGKQKTNGIYRVKT